MRNLVVGTIKGKLTCGAFLRPRGRYEVVCSHIRPTGDVTFASYGIYPDRDTATEIAKDVIREAKRSKNPKSPEVKELWQMTREEFIKKDLRRYREDARAIGFRLNETFQRKLSGEQHEKVVRRALSISKPVLPEVLKDYPDLAKAIPKAESRNPKYKPIKFSKVSERRYPTSTETIGNIMGSMGILAIPIIAGLILWIQSKVKR